MWSALGCVKKQTGPYHEQIVKAIGHLMLLKFPTAVGIPLSKVNRSQAPPLQDALVRRIEANTE